jgi:hypothetical protein
MGSGDVNFPSSEHVRFVSSVIPKLMEIADPPSELYRKLDLNQLIQVAAIGLKLQEETTKLEINRMQAQQKALADMQGMLKGFAK